MTITVYSMVQTIPATNYGHRSVELPLHFQCTLEAELPTANLQDGDTANTENTAKKWRRVAGAWVADTVIDVIAVALQETGGPTGLIIGTITDGQFLKRVGATLVSAVPPSGAAWGGITGTLSAQTDLQTALDAKQVSDAQLTSIAALAFTANALKVVRVNAGATDFELVTLAGGGDLLAANNLSDLLSASTARTNLGLGTAATTASTAYATSAQGATADTALQSIANGSITLAKMADMATASLIYRKTAATGVPEVNTLATLKTDLLLTGTNSGDQTSIVGITGTIAQFNTACSDADFATGGGTATGTNTGDSTVAAAGTLTGATLAANVTASSLLSVGAGLVFPAGSATAATKPKFTSGTLLTVPEAGAFEFDGNLFYLTTDATMGRSSNVNQMVFHTTADGAAIGPTIADAFGANSAFTTILNAAYEINYHCWFLKTTAGTSLWTVTNTQAYTAFTGVTLISVVGGIGAIGALSGSGLANQTTAAAAFPVSGSLTTAVQHYAHIKVNCTVGTAGNIRLRHTSSAGTITMRRGSYYTVRRLFLGNVGAFVA